MSAWLELRMPRLHAIIGDFPRDHRGHHMYIPRDELWTSYDGSSQYYDNQWMMFA